MNTHLIAHIKVKTSCPDSLSVIDVFYRVINKEISMTGCAVPGK